MLNVLLLKIKTHCMAYVLFVKNKNIHVHVLDGTILLFVPNRE